MARSPPILEGRSSCSPLLVPGANACFILAADGARGVLPPDPRRLSVSDEDAWVVATVIRGPQSGHVRLRRDDAPPGVDIEVERPEAEVAACSIVSDSEPTLAACEDIVGLGDVNFGAMLHSFRLRLEKDRIFTNIGPVLVVMNPYRARHLRDAFTKPRPLHANLPSASPTTPLDPCGPTPLAAPRPATCWVTRPRGAVRRPGRLVRAFDDARDGQEDVGKHGRERPPATRPLIRRSGLLVDGPGQARHAAVGACVW